MKKTALAIFTLLLVVTASLVQADYQQDIGQLTKRVGELAGSDTGLSDAVRFTTRFSGGVRCR